MQTILFSIKHNQMELNAILAVTNFSLKHSSEDRDGEKIIPKY